MIQLNKLNKKYKFTHFDVHIHEITVAVAFLS